MRATTFPERRELTVCFAHVAYQLQERFAARQTGIASFQVRSRAELQASLLRADVLVVSGFWTNDLIESAPKLRFIQSISAGVDQYSIEKLSAGGIRLASAKGANAAAVAEHALALMLALLRRLPEARDNQMARRWRGMVSDFARREDEIDGKTVLIVGLGTIGGRLARLCRALGLQVVGIKREAAPDSVADRVHTFQDWTTVLPEADFVVLTCALTPDTRHIVDAAALARMKPSAYLVNVARGGCVDESALIEALQTGGIAAAALDVTAEEPLPATSRLWAMENVLITSHTAGETRRYEDNVLDLLMENLERLWRGEPTLRNQVL